MAASDSPIFPLVDMEPVADAANAWQALTLRPGDGGAAALHCLFDDDALLTAVAPLACILFLDSPAVLTPALLALMPSHRVLFAFNAAALAVDAVREQALALRDAGYRILLDGPVPEGMTLPPSLRARALDCSAGAPPASALAALCGPHLAREVGDAAVHLACQQAGFAWFSGSFLLHRLPCARAHDGSSRKRMLALLGLLARDAEACELETLLKQDPALSYHLLKLANSAAFAPAAAVTSFSQAIKVMGRRQLQRWLQLLLYARRSDDGPANPLLPLAAQRASQMAALRQAAGADRDDQDLAFMTGMFSLLDLLLDMPMHEIVAALNLSAPASEALCARAGPLGRLLALVERPQADPEGLRAAAVSAQTWWRSRLQAYHWAIQVGGTL